MPHAVGSVGKVMRFGLATLCIEQAQLHAFGDGGIQGEVGAAAAWRRAEPFGRTFADHEVSLVIGVRCQMSSL